jgi:CRP-like cAMP-binding protein
VAVGKNAKLDLLSHVPLFAKCSKAELQRISAIADELDLPAGRVLIEQGDRGREFFVLLEGSVDVSVDGICVSALHEGHFFGEMALVSDVPRKATVTTTTPVRVLVITDRDFKRLLRDTPAIQGKVLEAIGSRLAELAHAGRW